MNIYASLALALFLGGNAAWAQGAIPATGTARKNYASAHRHESGVVMAVDVSAGKLSVKDDAGKVRKFSALRARIDAAEGKRISLADIAIGDEVSLSYKLSYRGKEAIEILRLRKTLKK